MFEFSNTQIECDTSCREVAVIESMSVFAPFLEGMDEYDDVMEGFFKAAGKAIDKAIENIKKFCKSVVDYLLGPKFVRYNKYGVIAIEKWNSKASDGLTQIAKVNANVSKTTRFFDDTSDIEKELREIMEKAKDEDFVSEKGTIKSLADKISSNINANIKIAEQILDGSRTNTNNTGDDEATAKGIITYCNVWLKKILSLVKIISKENRGTKEDRKQYRKDVKSGRDENRNKPAGLTDNSATATN